MFNRNWLTRTVGRNAAVFAKLLQANTFNNLISFGITLVIARTLGPEEFSRIGVSISVVVILGLLFDFGLGATLVRQYYDSDDDISRTQLIGVVLQYKLLIFLLLLVSIPLLGRLVIQIYPILSGYEWLVFEAIISSGLFSIWTTLRAIEQAKRDFSIYTRYLVAYGILRLITFAVCYQIAGVVPAIVMPTLYIVPLVTLTTAYFIFNRGSDLIRFDVHIFWTRIVKALKYGVWVAISGFSYTILSRIPQVFLSHRSTPDEVGLYSAALTFLVVFSLLNMSARTVILPQITALRDEDGRGRFRKKVWRLAPVFFFAMILALVSLAWFQSVFLGGDYKESVPVFVVMGFGMIATIYFGLLNSLVHSYGVPQVSAFINVGRVLIFVTAMALLPVNSLTSAIVYSFVLVIGELVTYYILNRPDLHGSFVSQIGSDH